MLYQSYKKDSNSPPKKTTCNLIPTSNIQDIDSIICATVLNYILFIFQFLFLKFIAKWKWLME